MRVLRHDGNFFFFSSSLSTPSCVRPLLPSPCAFPPGPTLDVPSTVTPPQLEALVNSVKGASRDNDDNPTLPYAFSVAGTPLAGPAAALGPHLAATAASLEGATLVTCRPQAPFRVRPVTRCAASLPGHTEAVLAAVFSPDGTRLASGSGDTTVRLWDLTTAGPLAVLGGHGGWVLALAWSPDGAFLASGGMDAGVLIWEGAGTKAGGGGTARPAPLGACKGHTKWVTCLAWEPLHAVKGGGGCRRLATGSKDSTVKVCVRGSFFFFFPFFSFWGEWWGPISTQHSKLTPSFPFPFALPFALHAHTRTHRSGTPPPASA